MADENKTKGGGTAVADDEWEYSGPSATQKPAGDDEWEYSGPSATTPVAAAKPVQPVQKPKSWLGKAWDAGVQGVEHSADPSNLFSRGAGAVGDWANKKAEEARTEEQKNVAAGGNAPAHPYLTPSAGYDLLARGAKTISGATSPQAAVTTAATIAAPEIMGPSLLLHGGINAVQGVQRIMRGDTSPENVGNTINSAAETVGGLGVIGHQVGTGQRGPINQAIADRSPVERGTQAYQDIISPNGSRAAQQVEDLETIRRARPYLAEEARRNPVLKKQPNNPTDPNAGRQLGVANYRQNAGAAADRLWTDKIEPLTKSYGKAPVDGNAIAQQIRGTINPDSPVDTARAEAVENLAKFYEKTSTVEDATRKIRALNEDRAVQAYEKALPDKQAEMIAADPTLDAKIKAANLLRDGVFDSIDKNGSPQEANYLREARKDFGALRSVSENLGKAQVPTPTSTGEKIIEAGHTAVRPISRTGPTASRLFSNPNRLAAKSSRLFGASDLQPRVAPALPPQPFAPAPPQPFIAPPGAPQAPPPVPPQFATQATGTVTGTAPGMRGAGAARIAGLLPDTAESLVPPSSVPPRVAPQFAIEGTGTVANPEMATAGRAPTGTRFGPKGLLPGPIHGTLAQPVGAPPIMGFPADQGLWNVPPRPGNVPGFETPPNAFAEPPAGHITRAGGLGTIGTPDEFAGRTPPELDRPFPKGGVEHGVQRRTMFEKEADAKAGKAAPAKPTDEQYQEAKNALKTPATLEPEELAKHRATVKAFDAAKETQTGKDVEAARKTGTANDRPQVKYKPSEKAATMSEERKPLGKEFDQGELTHEVERNRAILDNKDATEEEKSAANKFFEENPDRKVEKTPTGATAAERIAARNGGGEGPKLSTDTNGIRWAEKTVDGRNIKVSVPKRIPDAEVNDYANKMIAEQAKGQSEMHSNLFGKKNSEASVDQVFGRDKGAEEKAATEHGERREANRTERLRDQAESAQRIFEGKEPEPANKVSWLKMGAERAGAEAKPVQEEFTQEEIRNGEQAALADAEATLQSDRPGQYFDRTDPGESNTPLARRNEGTRQFGSWRGVSSGRGLYPVLRALPDMSATEVVRALRNPKSPAYQKVVRAAIKANQSQAARSAKLGLDKE